MTERKKRVKVAIINSWHRDLFHNPETGEPLQVVNPDSLMTQVEAAAETGADLLALSEYFEIDDAIRDRLSEIARKHGCYISAAGWGENPQFFALLFGRDGAVIGRYDVVTDGGREFPVFDTEIGRIAFKVCRDIKEQELDRAYGLKQVDILLWPTLASGPSGELLLLKDRGRAIDNGFHVISSHLISSDTGLYSTIVDHNGNVVFAVPWYEEGVFVHELILCDQGWFDPQLMVEGFLTNWPKHQVAGWPERVPEFRRDFRAVKLACRRPELYGPIMTADRSAHKH